jgi:predicted ATPase
MYISSIDIKSFRHLKNIQLGPFHQNELMSECILIAGPNGGGKSSILELIGFALSNSWSLGWSLNRSFPTNSFEITIGLTNEEIELITNHLAENEIQYTAEVLEYLSNTSFYYRGYNYPEGEYAKDQALYNRIHGIVSTVLRNTYKRSFGFFLKSDRNYPKKAFDRKNIFAFDGKKKKEHLWSIAFNTSDVQYQDMFDYLVQLRYHYLRDLGTHHHNASKGVAVGDPPKDPIMVFDELLNRLFPHYKFVDKEESTPTNLFIEIPNGDVIPFQDLSSGEKEVFFILSFFIRYDVNNAVIVIDEPEMHLHPELARLLIRTMQTIRQGNQIWLATHNTEIIDEIPSENIYYIYRDLETRDAVLTRATDEHESIKILRDYFGFSGYIGIANKLVFLEGKDASSDRKTFSNLFSTASNDLKFIPSNSSENIHRINAAILSIIESGIGWLDFHLIRDRDYLTNEEIEKFNNHPSGKIYVLPRHEIENYLIDETVISGILDEIYGVKMSAEEVTGSFISICQSISAQVVRDSYSYRMNLTYRPEDFNIGKVLQNETVIKEGAVDAEKVEILNNYFLEKTKEINQALNERTDEIVVKTSIEELAEEIMNSTVNGNWKTLFPGKEVIDLFCKKHELGDSNIFRNLIIKELSAQPELINQELVEIVKKITTTNNG